MKLELSVNQRMEQRLAPQIIQSIEILQLPAMDLQELIQKELAENEALEELSDAPSPSESDAMQQVAEEGREGEVPNEAADTDGRELEFDKLERLDVWDEQYGPRTRRVQDSEKDKKLEAMQNTASRSESLQDHISAQFKLIETDELVKRVGDEIIYNINANGYLQYGLREILEASENLDDIEGIDELDDEETGGGPAMQLAERALALIQGLEPRGVGARDVRECLLLQLDPKDIRYHLKKRLLEHHLEDIQKNKIPKIAKETGEDIDTINDMVHAIARLDLNPGSIFSSDLPHYIHPDVIVDYVDGRYEVRLEDGYSPNLRVSPSYRQMYDNRDVNGKVREYLKKKMDSAKWLIESIQQRQSTLHKVACEIVKYQTDFFDFGVHHLKPLKMEKIADTVGIHVSTVSRAISDKYLQCHRGIFPMKFFFSGATESASGAAESRVSVKTRVQEIIDEEDKKHPLSDEDIADILNKKHGLEIARRTVTKYRKALSIPSSRQRREY